MILNILLSVLIILLSVLTITLILFFKKLEKIIVAKNEELTKLEEDISQTLKNANNLIDELNEVTKRTSIQISSVQTIISDLRNRYESITSAVSFAGKNDSIPDIIKNVSALYKGIRQFFKSLNK